MIFLKNLSSPPSLASEIGCMRSHYPLSYSCTLCTWSCIMSLSADTILLYWLYHYNILQHWYNQSLIFLFLFFLFILFFQFLFLYLPQIAVSFWPIFSSFYIKNKLNVAGDQQPPALIIYFPDLSCSFSISLAKISSARVGSVVTTSVVSSTVVETSFAFFVIFFKNLK